MAPRTRRARNAPGIAAPGIAARTRRAPPDPLRKLYANGTTIVTRRVVEDGIRDWVEGLVGMAPTRRRAIARALMREVDVKTMEEFKDSVSVCLKWLRSKVRGRPYTLIMEKDILRRNSNTGVKSSAWLAHQVRDALGAPNRVIDQSGEVLYVDTSDKKNAKAAEKVLVHLDDAVYSGSQKEVMIWQMKRLVCGKPPPAVYVAAAYSTAKGARRVQSALEYSPASAFFYARSISEISPKTRDALQNIPGIALASTVTSMPYKVPNYVSFGARDYIRCQHLSHRVENICGVPRYKNKRFVPTVLPPRNSQQMIQDSNTTRMAKRLAANIVR